VSSSWSSSYHLLGTTQHSRGELQRRLRQPSHKPRPMPARIAPAIFLRSVIGTKQVCWSMISITPTGTARALPPPPRLRLVHWNLPHRQCPPWQKIMAKLTKPARDRISATKFAFPQATEGAAGKRFPRAQCSRSLQSCEGSRSQDVVLPGSGYGPPQSGVWWKLKSPTSTNTPHCIPATSDPC
jgi:hypothetical protein